jgi:hypothetical protein
MTGRDVRNGIRALALCLGLQLATDARADVSVAEPARWRLGVGPMVGGLAFDSSLDDYRWDVAPAFQTGAQATLARGRVATRARVWF